MCVYVCVCVRAKKKTCLICLRYTRLTLPPFHLFNEKNICGSNGERFEIERFVGHTHTYTHTTPGSWWLCVEGTALAGGSEWVCFPLSATTPCLYGSQQFSGIVTQGQTAKNRRVVHDCCDGGELM